MRFCSSFSFTLTSGPEKLTVPQPVARAFSTLPAEERTAPTTGAQDENRMARNSQISEISCKRVCLKNRHSHRTKSLVWKFSGCRLGVRKTTKSKATTTTTRNGMSTRTATISTMKRLQRSFFPWMLLFFIVVNLTLANEKGEEGVTTTRSEETTTLGRHETTTEGGEHSESEAEIEEPFAVLYPSLMLVFGTLIFLGLTRFIEALPYTACMFLLGTIIGLAVSANEFANPNGQNHIHQSVLLWQSINSEVLLLVFLPGLIFKDSLGQNVHLFTIALGQLFVFAFPMVLAGTVLTALVGYYILPYDWSFNLAMTFGSILSATDPVAVAALLEAVGAPPRLKTHIAGESLLNDGAAIVFYSIFSEKFFHELGILDFGEDIGWGEGIAMFCRKAMGGVAAGIFFGLGTLLLLYLLDRRFSREENVVQVSVVLAMAYLNYYVSDFVWKTSGVIATLTQGLMCRLLGQSAINDPHLFNDFFIMMEHILNTILFSLGGLVWGGVIVDNHQEGIWKARDWGYLILVYILLHIIRAVLFVGAYPLTVRIGLKTNWSETIFQIYGGLRGAVGIALAISLDNEVAEVFGGRNVSIFERETAILYQFVGGVAFLTLVINGSTAGPVLRKLGLADSTEVRHRIIDAYKIHFRSQMLDAFVELLTNDRFKHVDFALVKFHVPFLADLSLEQLSEAVIKLRDSTPTSTYRPPHLNRVLPYLKPEGMTDDQFAGCIDASLLMQDPDEVERKLRLDARRKKRKKRRSVSSMAYLMEGEPLSTVELRVLFISMIRSQYEYQMRNGELESQHLLAIALEQSLEEAEGDANNGLPLNDLRYLQQYHASTSRLVRATKKYARCCSNHGLKKKKRSPLERAEAMYVEQAMAFVSAHERAQFFFRNQILDGCKSDILEAAKVVLAESQKEIETARNELDTKLDKKVVQLAASHKFCKIILNRGVNYVDTLSKFGLLKESEAEELVEELEELLDHVISCDLHHHEGEMDLFVEESETDGVDLSILREVAVDKESGDTDDDDSPFAPDADEIQVSRFRAPDSDGEGEDSDGGDGPGMAKPEGAM